MGLTAVTNAGPLIHLEELGCIKALRIAELLTTPEVLSEVKTNSRAKVSVHRINPDKTAFYSAKHGIELGEASCIALCLETSVKLFFTDDLEARAAAQSEGIEVHGTIGIVIAAFSKKILSMKETIDLLRTLPQKSTLFITSSLIEKAIREILLLKKK